LLHLLEKKSNPKICKALLRDGRPCRSTALVKGYCILHYKILKGMKNAPIGQGYEHSALYRELHEWERNATF
jgi:hypothetical protein